jgi:UPF0271 protein
MAAGEGPSGPPGVVDLNADLGEEVTDDAALLAVVTSANVACGYHAGSPAVMRAVCEGAARHGVGVGAQVSYLDRAGFGRRRCDLPADLLAQQVADQVGLLGEAAAASGVTVRYLKPHGALYHRVVDDEEQAEAVLRGSGALPVLGLPGGSLLALAAAAGRPVYREGFPDRGYVETPRGPRLAPRDRPGAVIHDPEEIAARAVGLAPGVHSLCVHGDGPTAVAAARAVRRALEGAGYDLRSFA